MGMCFKRAGFRLQYSIITHFCVILGMSPQKAQVLTMQGQTLKYIYKHLKACTKWPRRFGQHNIFPSPIILYQLAVGVIYPTSVTLFM